MISAPLKALLAAIRKHEAPEGYGQIYSGAKGVKPGLDVSKMTLGGVLATQERMKDAGSASTACGGYQFIHSTLKETIDQLGLPLDRVWSPDLQDRMAIHLLQRRGLDKFMASRMSAEDFANNLAKEWASLPVVTFTIGARKTMLKPGQSYYAGDGLNRAFHKPAEILALIYALKYLSTAPTSMPAPDAPKPRGILRALIDLIMSLFRKGK